MRPIALLTAVSLGCTGPGTEVPPPDEGCSGELDVYEPGISTSSSRGTFTVELLEADPDPPDEGENTWVVRITDGSGPVPGATVAVEPWMPAHGHGLNPPTYVGQPAGEPGTFAIEPFELIMPGVWEFQLLVVEGMTSETATFTFCAEG